MIQFIYEQAPDDFDYLPTSNIYLNWRKNFYFDYTTTTTPPPLLVFPPCGKVWRKRKHTHNFSYFVSWLTAYSYSSVLGKIKWECRAKRVRERGKSHHIPRLAIHYKLIITEENSSTKYGKNMTRSVGIGQSIRFTVCNERNIWGVRVKKKK